MMALSMSHIIWPRGPKVTKEGKRRKVEKSLELLTEGSPCTFLGGGI